MESGTKQHLPRHIQAVIFDMDGLMLDTERLERESFERAAADFGYTGMDNVYLHTIGRNWLDTKKHFQDVLGETFPFEAFRKRWRQYSKQHVDEFGVPVKSGLEQLLKVLHGSGIPKAVATSTQRREALALLEKAGLLKFFTAVVAGDEVSRGKPHPDIFLVAAERLNAVPSKCVVFEDSPPGIRAAHAAGMIPILVPDLIPPLEETVRLAYRVLGSLDETLSLFHSSGDFVFP